MTREHAAALGALRGGGDRLRGAAQGARAHLPRPAAQRHAVLSNSSLRHQDRKLTVLGVRERFEAVVCADEIGVGKPAPAAFLAACEALRLPPGDVVYVGDEPDVDAAAAAAAGLAAVWLDRGGRGGRPELVRITGLGPLPALLRGTTRFGAGPGIG